MNIVNRLLAHPLTRDLSVDDPNTTLLRRDIIQGKAFLRALYTEWYQHMVGALGDKKKVLELGSGAGFFQQFLPNVITSEIFQIPHVKLVADACKLPFFDESLEAIVMTDVFHHIPNVRLFFHEATRCVQLGGKIVMLEPWRTTWSQFVYTHFHSEPFKPEEGWEIASNGPLSGANGALPWIIFSRDRALFEQWYPQWKIKKIKPMMPFSYLFSGGVSMRSLMPGWAYSLVRTIEKISNEKHWAMFALIELERSQ